MNSKFNELFDKIITESKKSTRKHIIKEDVDIETAKANFRAIAEKINKEFVKYDCYGAEIEEFKGDEEYNPSMEITWQWVDKNGVDESLQLYLDLTTGEATYSDNGGEGDIDINDVEGTAKNLIDEYIYNPEYGGIGCEDRTLEECVPEFLQQMSEDSDYSNLDWDNMDLDELADEFIDEYNDCGFFETEDEVRDQLQEWLFERFGDNEDQED